MMDSGNDRADLISEVRDILEDRAAQGKTITYREIRIKLSRDTSTRQWRTILNSIYDECIKVHDPDLTLIVVDQTGYPPFFSRGGEAQSVRFNADKHYELWQKELEKIFATWKARRGK